jgi:hypothetical protein
MFSSIFGWLKFLVNGELIRWSLLYSERWEDRLTIVIRCVAPSELCDKYVYTWGFAPG